MTRTAPQKAAVLNLLYFNCVTIGGNHEFMSHATKIFHEGLQRTTRFLVGAPNNALGRNHGTRKLTFGMDHTVRQHRLC